MSSRLNRGSSVLAALLLVGVLGVVALAVQALPGAQSREAMMAQTAVPLAPPVGFGSTVPSGGTTPAAGSSFSNKSPASCTAAKQAALNMLIGPGAISTDKGQSGTLDSCHGAVSKTGKPSANVNDYQCVGRSGTVLIANGIVTVTTNPDRSVEDGTCKVEVCNGGLDSCSAAKPYKGGLFASNTTGVTAGGVAPPVNFVPSLSGGDAGSGVAAATGYYVDANGAYQISSAFTPATPLSAPPSGWAAPSGFDPSLWPADGNTVVPIQFAPTTNSIYATGLDCSGGNCASLRPQDLTSSGGVYGQQPGDYQGESPAAIDEALRASRPAAGEVLKADTNCVKSVTPPSVVRIPAGSTFPSGCFNDRNAPQARNTTFPQGPGAQQQAQQTSPGSSGGLGGLMKAVLGGLAKALGGSPSSGGGAPCPSDPNAYAQQQQQYNQQLQQYNQQLQQYNYQQQISQLSGYPPPPPPIAPQPCQQTSNSNTCPQAPAQPTCPSGTTPRPVASQQSNGRQCTTSWQCVPSITPQPTAQISCQPQVADVGMSVAISYSCGNATGSQGQGFDSGNQTSGSTTTVISAPPAGATAANFGINCTNGTASAQSQCSVQISRPTIVLVANPKVVDPGGASTIGWITSGMQSCVVSSPELAEFTAENASNTSVNGMASTTPLSAPAHILLHCITAGGGTRDATTTVGVVGQPDIVDTNPSEGSVTVSSSADNGDVARGDTIQVSWSTTNPPTGAHIALWLYDVRLQTTTALIKTDLAASSTYAWQLPLPGDACDAESNDVCGTDLIPGRQYGIEAALYTPTSDPNSPEYLDYGFTPDTFTVSG